MKSREEVDSPRSLRKMFHSLCFFIVTVPSSDGRWEQKRGSGGGGWLVGMLGDTEQMCLRQLTLFIKSLIPNSHSGLVSLELDIFL